MSTEILPAHIPERPVSSQTGGSQDKPKSQIEKTSREVEPLSDEIKEQIWTAIDNHTSEDDTPPFQVIEESFEGNTERYLRSMAGWHNIKID